MGRQPDRTCITPSPGIDFNPPMPPAADPRPGCARRRPIGADEHRREAPRGACRQIDPRRRAHLRQAVETHSGDRRLAFGDHDLLGHDRAAVRKIRRLLHQRANIDLAAGAPAKTAFRFSRRLKPELQPEVLQPLDRPGRWIAVGIEREGSVTQRRAVLVEEGLHRIQLRHIGRQRCVGQAAAVLAGQTGDEVQDDLAALDVVAGQRLDPRPAIFDQFGLGEGMAKARNAAKDIAAADGGIGDPDLADRLGPDSDRRSRRDIQAAAVRAGCSGGGLPCDFEGAGIEGDMATGRAIGLADTDRSGCGGKRSGQQGGSRRHDQHSHDSPVIAPGRS